MDTNMKFKIGTRAFVVDGGEIPLGTEVMVQSALVLPSSIAYKVSTGAVMYWVEETQLSKRILDIAA